MKGKILISLCITGLLLLPLSSLSAPADQNEIKVYTGPKIVYDDKTTTDGVPDALTSDNNGKGKPPSPPQVDKWAVIIGIADYQGTGSDLQYPDDDARDMYDYLLSKGHPTGNIKLLTKKKPLLLISSAPSIG